jgi:hypothetical protein
VTTSHGAQQAAPSSQGRSRGVLRQIAGQFPNWVVNGSQKWGAPMLDEPEDRRDEFLGPAFPKAKRNQIVAILKTREDAQPWWCNIPSTPTTNTGDGCFFAYVPTYFSQRASACRNQHSWLAARPLRRRLCQTNIFAITFCCAPSRLLRSFEAPCKRPGRQASALPAVLPAAAGLPHLPGLPQGPQTGLRSAHSRSTRALLQRDKLSQQSGTLPRPRSLRQPPSTIRSQSVNWRGRI